MARDRTSPPVVTVTEAQRQEAMARFAVLQLTFRTPSDGEPRILPAACFARTANPNRDMVSSHARRYVTPRCLRSVVWDSCYRPSKPTKSNICPL